MNKECINAEHAPPAVGPYSHAVAAGEWLYVSGQCPFAVDGSGPVRGTIEEEARLVLENLKTVLEAGGSSLAQVVKITAYLKDMGDFAAFNGVYAEFFPENPPARTCIQAGRLPLDIQVEVDAVALRHA